MMLDAVTAAQVAMIQDQLRIQSISQNVSNMQTPAYKRQLTESMGFDEQMQANMLTVNQQMQTTHLQIQGSVVQTQNPNDLAISGDGFFEVQTEKGIFYTRRGDCHINERGELATATGELVLGQNGVLHLDDNPFTINSQGTVYIDNRKVDQIKIVQFSQVQQLKYLGQGLYESTENPQLATGDTRLLQGFIEQSSVKSVDEMMELVKTSRHFEASQRVMRTADSLLAAAINQLGEGNV